jgi:hypothetical protein
MPRTTRRAGWANRRALAHVTRDKLGHGHVQPEADERAPVMRMTYPRRYGSADGEMHVQDIAVHMSPGPGVPELVNVGSAQPAIGLTFGRLERRALARSIRLRAVSSCSCCPAA